MLRTLALILLATFSLNASLAAQTRPASDELRETLEHIRAEHGVPALGLAMHDGDSTRIAVVGTRSADDATPVDAGDAWHIGSCTKALTAILAARLVEQGLIEWDATPGEILPDLPLSVKPQNRDVTLRQLLSHTSGMPGREADAIVLPIAAAQAALDRPPGEQRRAVADAVLSLGPVAKPGEQWGYLNGGYIVASAMLETAAGVAFEELMRREVFEPLGITSAGWGPPAAIMGHTRGGDGWSPTDLDNPKAYDAAGRLHVSLADWVTLCRVMLGEPDGYLSDESLAMLTTAMASDPRYALGWVLLENKTLGPILQHTGSNTVWFAQAIVAPERNLVLVVVGNAAKPEAIQQATDAAVTAVLSCGEAK